MCNRRQNGICIIEKREVEMGGAAGRHKLQERF